MVATMNTVSAREFVAGRYMSSIDISGEPLTERVGIVQDALSVLSLPPSYRGGGSNPRFTSLAKVLVQSGGNDAGVRRIDPKIIPLKSIGMHPGALFWTLNHFGGHCARSEENALKVGQGKLLETEEYRLILSKAKRLLHVRTRLSPRTKRHKDWVDFWYEVTHVDLVEDIGAHLVLAHEGGMRNVEQWIISQFQSVAEGVLLEAHEAFKYAERSRDDISNRRFRIVPRPDSIR